MMHRQLAVAGLWTMVIAGCADRGGEAVGVPRVDTLPSGTLHVVNSRAGAWSASDGWQIRQGFHLGALDAAGPEQFSQVRALEVDAVGRVYVLDRDAREIRVFDTTGAHVRTFAGEGAGPGELRRPMTMLFDPAGHLRVLDPQNNRISVFDTSGAYLAGHAMPGSFFTTRWPGGYDSLGFFYQFLPMTQSGPFRFALVRHDATLVPIDTIEPPSYEGESFRYTSPDGNNRLQASVPFTPRLRWWFDRRGSIWSTVTGEYRLIQQSLAGDTLRIVDLPSHAVPVRPSDRDSALSRLAWFADEGGQLDASRIPAFKPRIDDFFVDDDGYLWVMPSTQREAQGLVVDVFDPAGVYLGQLDLPARLDVTPRPVVAAGALHFVTSDALGVQYVVRGTIVGR